MQRVARILVAVALVSGLFAGHAALAFGHGGGHAGGFHGGWHGGGFHGGWHGGYGGWGGWGWGAGLGLGWGYWGYPYYYDYGYPPDYGYEYDYPPEPTVSPYCATRTQVCLLRRPRDVGTGCICKGARGVISGGPPQ